jgi:hypothetical protein
MELSVRPCICAHPCLSAVESSCLRRQPGVGSYLEESRIRRCGARSKEFWNYFDARHAASGCRSSGNPAYLYDNSVIVEVEADSLDVRLADREYALVFMDIE